MSHIETDRHVLNDVLNSSLNNALNPELLDCNKDSRIHDFDVDKKTYKTNNSSSTFRKMGENASRGDITIKSNNMVVEKKYNQTDDRKKVMLPISEFEQFYPDFLNRLTHHRLLYGITSEGIFYYEVPDLKDGIEDIREFLEEKSIKTKIIRSNVHYRIQVKETYELPVIGIHIMDRVTDRFYDTKNSTANKNSFYETYESLYNFQGKYDPTVLYILMGVNSFARGPKYNFINAPIGTVEINFTAHNKYKSTFAKIVKYPADAITPNTSYKMFAQQSYWYFDSSLKNKKKNNTNKRMSEHIILKIDPNDNIKIKYISVMGRPYAAKYYPQYSPTKGYDNIHTRAHYDNRVFIMDEPISNTNYVKRIEVHGKVDGGKWVFIGTYDCNFDRVTEKLIDLEIPDNFDPTYLKIIPLTYEGVPSMRFCMYGVSKNTDTDTVKNFETNTDTITYTIVYDDEVYYTFDGIQFYGSPDWYFSNEIQNHEDYDNLRIDLNEYTKKYNNNIADDNYDDIYYKKNIMKDINQYGSLFNLDNNETD